MAIVIGDNTNNSLQLTGDPARNYGLEDDRVASFDGNDNIDTGAGNDFIDAGRGNDAISDGDGNDTVVAGAGDDSVFVDAGNDIYYGGEGTDALFFFTIHDGAGGSESNLSGVTIDLASTARQDLGEFGYDRFFGFESVFGGGGGDTILGTGGANFFSGSHGDDTLFGRNGNDTLAGGNDADVLIGGRGADLLDPGTGVPVQPDAASDIIRYLSLQDSGATPDTRDRIVDFELARDKIDLSPIDAVPNRAGNQAFKVVSHFTSAPGEVKLEYSDADTIVQVDGDRDTAVDMTIFVLGVHLTAADFIL